MKLTLMLLTGLLLVGCGVSMHEVKVEIARHEIRETWETIERSNRMVGWIASVEKKADLKTLVKLWDEYDKTVNDSVIYAYEYIGDSTTHGLYMLKGKPLYMRTIYPTFNGFIEYLRGKK